MLSRLVVRIAGMGPDGHDRRGVRDDAVGAKLSEDPLLQIEFSERFSRAHAARRFGECRLRDLVDRDARGAMRVKLLRQSRLPRIVEQGRRN